MADRSHKFVRPKDRAISYERWKQPCFDPRRRKLGQASARGRPIKSPWRCGACRAILFGSAQFAEVEHPGRSLTGSLSLDIISAMKPRQHGLSRQSRPRQANRLLQRALWARLPIVCRKGSQPDLFVNTIQFAQLSDELSEICSALPV